MQTKYKAHTELELENAVLNAIRETLAAKGQPAPLLGPDTLLDRQLGLDSLDWAAVVVRLEEATGLDPFASGSSRDLRTLRDLTAIYMDAQ